MTDDPEHLKARVKQLEGEISAFHRAKAELCQDENNLRLREEKMEEIEDEFYRERNALRARVRNRERDQLEKAMHATRLEAVKALRSMLRTAKSQAKKGKPALLRLILRSTR
jgi:predicted  nucleic acid-binding Zn-ribbon protein